MNDAIMLWLGTELIKNRQKLDQEAKQATEPSADSEPASETENSDTTQSDPENTLSELKTQQLTIRIPND